VGQLFLMEVEHRIDRRVGPIEAVDVDRFHGADDGVPTGFIEAVLQRVAWRMAARAVVAEDLLHAQIVGRVAGQAREDQIAGQLDDPRFGILDRRKREVLLLDGAERDLGLRGGEADRLRPQPVLAFGQGREHVGAVLVGEDRCRDGLADFLGRDRDPAHFPAGRTDRAVQQDVCRGRQRGEETEHQTGAQ
jgi:hypothetical protein